MSDAVLVPREPTEAMIDNAAWYATEETARDIYRAMLAASPSVGNWEGSRPQEAVPTEGLSPLVVALCESLRDNDDPNEPIADNGASVIDGWRDLARRILSTPQPAEGCSSNEGAGQ